MTFISVRNLEDSGSTLLNLQRVDIVERALRGGCVITMAPGKRIETSESYAVICGRIDEALRLDASK